MTQAARSPRRGKKPKVSLKKSLERSLSRLFSKRSVIIISDHATQHVPFSAGVQAAIAVAVLGFVGFGSFSGGSYMAAQRVIDEKEQRLANYAQENARVEAEFSLLKQDLMKLADNGKDAKGSKTAEAAKALAQQYASQPTASAAASSEGMGDDAAAKYNAVFNRIQFLENKVRELQTNHDEMMADIRATTGGKIKELEKVIARTGVAPEPLTRAAEAKRVQEEQRREKYGRAESAGGAAAPVAGGVGGPNLPVPAAASSEATTGAGGQGGPFIPVSAGAALKEKDAELYFNLRKLMTLNEVVHAMPLASPMASNDFHQTSGFGTRVDPFRGALSFHAGVDLAGESGSKVVASNDGRVDFAGWKTAYGNVIDLKHEYGFGTRYGHLSRILVRPGQVVKKGQVIGIQGSTGRSTGEHLHYEVHYQDKPINPANFLKAGENVRALD